jgi:hypothetical protein
MHSLSIQLQFLYFGENPLDVFVGDPHGLAPDYLLNLRMLLKLAGRVPGLHLEQLPESDEIVKGNH